MTVTKTAQPPIAETRTVTPTPAPSPSGQSRPAHETTLDNQTSLPDPSDAEIKTTTAHAYNVVNTYWVNLFASWHDDQGNPVRWWTPDRYHGDGSTTPREVRLPAAVATTTMRPTPSFCSDASGTGFLAWDLVLFRREAAFGDAPIYYSVAHEFGHPAQARFQADREDGASPPRYNTMRNELQAYCLAGATLAKAEQDGYLTPDPDDYARIITALAETNESGDHGTDAQRIAAYSLGYHGDIESCLYNKGIPPAPELVG